jgi:hypothetical protein
MKPVGSFSGWIACGVSMAALLMAASAQAVVGKAQVSVADGTVQYSVQGGEFKTLKEGTVLGPGTIVKTGVSSKLRLYLGENGPDVQLLPETTLGLDKLNIERSGVENIIETELNLKAGTIQGHVKKLASASKYIVKTPYTVCEIKGTDYQISADGILHVLEGAMIVAYTNPSTGQLSTFTVNAGQTFIPPVNPATQNPTVVPTNQLPPNIAPPLPPLLPLEPPQPPPPVTVVPEPIVVISPGTGAAAR